MHFSQYNQITNDIIVIILKKLSYKPQKTIIGTLNRDQSSDNYILELYPYGIRSYFLNTFRMASSERVTWSLVCVAISE